MVMRTRLKLIFALFAMTVLVLPVVADVVDYLILDLKCVQADVREDTAIALGEIGDARAVDPLIGTLKDDDWRVIDAATEALAKLEA